MRRKDGGRLCFFVLKHADSRYIMLLAIVSPLHIVLAYLLCVQLMECKCCLAAGCLKGVTSLSVLSLA